MTLTFWRESALQLGVLAIVLASSLKSLGLKHVAVLDEVLLLDAEVLLDEAVLLDVAVLFNVEVLLEVEVVLCVEVVLDVEVFLWSSSRRRKANPTLSLIGGTTASESVASPRRRIVKFLKSILDA